MTQEELLKLLGVGDNSRGHTIHDKHPDFPGYVPTPKPNGSHDGLNKSAIGCFDEIMAVMRKYEKELGTAGVTAVGPAAAYQVIKDSCGDLPAMQMLYEAKEMMSCSARLAAFLTQFRSKINGKPH